MYTLILLQCLNCQPYVALAETFNTVQACAIAGQVEASKQAHPPYRIICVDTKRVSYYLGRNRA
jgi:hypothetical protein